MRPVLLTLLVLFSAQTIFAQVKKAPAHKPVASKNRMVVSPTSKASMTNGQAVYSQSCVSCHQPDGYGVQNMNPPLIKTSYVLGDKTRLINILLKGLSHQEIDGNMYQNVMPSHDFLTDQQIADVLTYVRNSFGNKASAVTEPEVKAQRAKK
ncbi:MAG: cytochrome c [Mucilaginibacter sp.]|uniref:c-type cytochrome n=1 Tax=Mucilaginibacter sp. TaxID=1882438 RepID=UPI0034E56CA8